MMKSDLEIIEEFCRHYCIVCKKRIAVMCGTPVVHVSGCCVGIDHESEKTFYMRTLKAHIWCFDETREKEQKKLKKPEWKLRWKFEEILPVVMKDE